MNREVLAGRTLLAIATISLLGGCCIFGDADFVAEQRDGVSVGVRRAAVGVWDYDIMSGRSLVRKVTLVTGTRASQCIFRSGSGWVTSLEPEGASMEGAPTQRVTMTVYCDRPDGIVYLHVFDTVGETLFPIAGPY